MTPETPEQPLLLRCLQITIVVTGLAIIIPAPAPVQECLAFAVATLAYGRRRR